NERRRTDRGVTAINLEVGSINGEERALDVDRARPGRHGGIAAITQVILVPSPSAEGPHAPVILRPTQEMFGIERRASIELHRPQVAVEVDPVAGRAGAAQLRALPDASVRAGVQRVRAGEDG